MNIEYYIKEFGGIRKERFASFKKAPYNDSINRYTRFFTDEFQKPEYLENLVFTKEEGEYSLEKVAEHTYSFENFYAKSNALNPLNNDNDIERFKRNFKKLIEPIGENKYADIINRIKEADEELKYWGLATISEIVGQCFTDDFVFFNNRNKEALHFFELKPTGDKYKYYANYQKHIERYIKPLYQQIIWDKIEKSERYSIGIEINSFFSWIYERYIKTKSNLLTNGNEVFEIIHSDLDGISIKNYFSIKNIELNNLKKSKEIYILGENGVGKTLFLQAIILATKWHVLENSDGKTSGKLRSFYQNKENRQLEITIKGSGANRTKDFDNEDIIPKFILSDKENISKKSLKNIFAYGVHRSRSDREEKFEFLSLFGEDKVLKDPIQWLIRLDSLETKIKLHKIENPNQPLPHNLEKPHIPLAIVKEFLKEILLKNIEINIEYNDVLFIENKTKNLTIDQLADGYKSVFVWVVDLFARLSENQPNARKLEDFIGVVLIDELDLFLHVKWAQDMVSMLRKWFKGIQFIITTHSPILVLSASKDAVFYKLYKEDGETKISEPLKGLSDLMLNGLVTSPLFGLSSARSKVFQNVENISNDDYITFKVHQALSKKMEEEPSATEDEFMKWGEMELEKELANQNE